MNLMDSGILRKLVYLAENIIVKSYAKPRFYAVIEEPHTNDINNRRR